MNHLQCRSCLEKIGVMTISIMNFVLVFEEREKNSSNFEHYDLEMTMN
jgi:hypothetical protein